MLYPRIIPLAVYMWLKYLEMFEIVFVFPEVKLTPYIIHATVLDNGKCFNSKYYK